MTSLFRPRLPVLISGGLGNGGGGTSISNSTSSISIVNEGGAGSGAGSVRITTNGTPALDIDNQQFVIIGNKNNVIANHRLTVVDPSGQCIQLINSAQNSLVNLVANSTGGLSITTSGSNIQLGSNNIHIGLNSLYIGSTLVTSTATQLNYTTSTPGSATGEKALVVDSNRNISNINSLEASALFGVLQTGIQPNITALNSVNIASLSLSGTQILSNANEINYLRGIIPGIITPGRAVVVDISSSIHGLNSVGASKLTGTLQTSSQPNITSLGKLSDLKVDEYISIGNPNPTRALDILTSNPVISLSNGAFGTELSIDLNGNFRMNPDRDIIISSHKNLLFSGTSNIHGLNSLNASNIFGMLQTSAQPNITLLGALSSLNVEGDVLIGSTSVSSTSRRLIISEPNGQCFTLARSTTIRCDLNLNNQGDLELNLFRDLKILNGSGIRTSGPIIGVTDLSANTISGVLQTAAQPNITSIGTLSSLIVTNTIASESVSASTLSGTIITPLQPNITSLGTLSSLAVTNSISSASVIASTLTGTIQTAAQPKITSVGTLSFLNVENSLTASSISASTLAGTLTSSDQPNIRLIGTLNSLNVSGAINALNVISSTLEGEILTASQPNITSLGTLSSLIVSNEIVAKFISASTVTGVLQTALQPNITSLGTLSSLNVSNGIVANSVSASTLTGTIQTALQPNITLLGTLSRLSIRGPIGIGTETPTSVIDINTETLASDAIINITDGLNSGSFALSSSGITINTSGPYLSLGSGVGLRFISGTITGLSNLTASTINGTILTSSQPNITSLGKLDYLDTDYIGLGTDVNDFRLNVFDTSGKMLMMSNGVLSLITSIVGGDFTINTSNDRLALGHNVDFILNGGTIIGLTDLVADQISGTIVTPNQPNITSLGVLDSLNVDGNISANDASLESVVITGNLTVGGSLNLSTPLSFSNLSSRTAVFDSNIPASSSTDGGTLTVIGGASFSDNVFIGTSLTLGTSTLTEDSLEAISGLTPGIVNPNKLLLVDENKNLTGFGDLSATNYFGTLRTAYQPHITTVGNLDNLNVLNYLGVGTASPTRQLEISSPTGDCLRLCHNKISNQATAFVDFRVNELGNAILFSSGGGITLCPTVNAKQLILGNSTNATMPLEIGFVPFIMTQPYAFNTSANAKGIFTPPAINPPSYNYSIRALGRILCTQSLDVTSDRRTKKNVSSLTDEFCTSFIEQTRPVSFNWKEGDDNKSFGYIAQELVRAGFPDLVNLAIDDTVVEEIDEDGFVNPGGVKFTVSYQHIIPILAKNQKRLMQENENLKMKIAQIFEMLRNLS